MTQFGENPNVLRYSLDYFLKAVSSEEYKKTFDIFPSEKWTEEVLDWFKKTDLTRPRRLKKNQGYKWLVRGKVRGEIFGGCIPSINHLAGTEYWPNIPKNAIFFLDIPEGCELDKGMPVSEVDSYLADLDNLGLFDSIAGLIIGRPYHYSRNEEEELKNIILKYVKKRKCPTLYGANIGHTDPIVTLRYGATVELNSSSNLFRIHQG